MTWTKSFVLILGVAAILVLTPTLSASDPRIIEQSAIKDTVPMPSSVTIQGATLTSFPRPFSHLSLQCQDLRGATVTGLGVSGGFINGEIDHFYRPPGHTIDSPSESITIEYPRPTVVTSITLSFLFHDQCHDVVDETAQVQVDGGTVYELTAAGDKYATWTGSSAASVVNVSSAGCDGCGVWTILMPFNNTPVTRLKFSAKLDPQTLGAAGSDFAIVSVSDQEPGLTGPPPCRQDRDCPPASPKPDLIPTSIQCDGGVPVRASVCNVGNAYSPMSVARVNYGGVITDVATPALAPGQCVLVSFNAPSTCIPGRCTFSLTANAVAPIVDESNLANNTITGSCRLP